MSAEIEVKLIIEAEALQKLLASPLITEKIVPGSEEVQHLATSYYDTAVYSLMKNGIAYRVRQNGDKFEATIKTEKEAHGAFSSRNEYNIDLPDATPVLQGFETVGFNRDLVKITGGEPLQKLFTVSVERKLCLLKITEATTLELAVDCGQITSPFSTEVCPINETELEIKSGSKEDLLAYVDEIAKLVPISGEERSKYERGMKLCGVNLK